MSKKILCPSVIAFLFNDAITVLTYSRLDNGEGIYLVFNSVLPAENPPLRKEITVESDPIRYSLAPAV
jgi:hypothetical protein